MRQPALVVAGVDDQVHRLLDPLGRLLGAQIVEHEQIGGHHRPQHLELGGPDRRIVGAANDAQQIARVVEQAARRRRIHHLLEDGDGEMRLADAGQSPEQQPASLLAEVVGRREALRHATRLLERAFERRVVGGEILERAVLIALRNVRGGQAMPTHLLAPAVAADDAADALLCRRASTPCRHTARRTSTDSIRSRRRARRLDVAGKRLVVRTNAFGYFWLLTRSVGDDFTSAVESRASQSSTPRAISFLT